LERLLFAHWRADVEELRPLVPPSLEVQTSAGSAWLGITAFRVNALRLRGALPVPRLSSFLGLNVRTYVTAGGRPGIWFFSLDVDSRLAVEAARRTYVLPYFRARMTSRRRDEWIEHESARAGSGEHPHVFSARFRPRGAAAPAAPGSIEEFLVERYCLYAVDRRGCLCRADVHHRPWSLQEADAEVELNTMAPPEVRLPEEPPLTHFVAQEDVVIWPLERVASL
jgi:uncharacterized protein YqjF (DUF2071 family)